MLFTEGVVFVVDAYVNVVRQEHWAMRKIDEGGCDEMCGAMALIDLFSVKIENVLYGQTSI